MSMFWRSLRDEALCIARDSGALLIMVLGVLAYGVIYPIPYERAVVRDVPVVVVDEDGTALSRQLARMVDAHAATSVVATVPDRAEAEREIAAGRASGALVVPNDFERNVLRGAHAEVLAICDATVFLVYKTAFTGMAESTGTLSAGVEIKRLEAHGVPGWEAQRMRAPARGEVRPLFNPTEGYTAYVVPAVYVLILHQTLLIGIGLLQGTKRERNLHAAAHGHRHGPVKGLMRLLGRTVPYAALYAVHVVIYFGVLLPWLGLRPHVPPATLAWFLTPFVLATIWLGFPLGAVFRTRESAMATLFVTSAPLVFSIGFAWPVEAMAPWVPAMVQWFPATSGVNGIIRLSQMGASRAEAWREWSWLWTLAVGYFVSAWVMESLSREPAAGGIDDRRDRARV